MIKFFLFSKLKFCKLLLNKKNLKKKFKFENLTRIFIDNNFELTGYYNIISSICKKHKILLFELPHSLTLSKRKIIKKNKNINNIQVYNSDYEITQFIDNKEKFAESGSFKYDKWWQDILNKKFFVPSKKKFTLRYDRS